MNDIKESSSTAKNFGFVLGSNILSLIRGVVVSLVIPKILTVEAYGDYKLFALYLTYIGLLHFGLIDGICVKYAGKTIEEIGREKLKAFSLLLVIIEIFDFAVLFSIGMIAFEGTMRVLICLYALDIPIHNLTSYTQSLMQITMSFKRYAFTNVLSNALQLLGVALLWLLSCMSSIDAVTYIVIFIASEAVVCLLCLILMRNSILGRCKFDVITREIKDVFSKGVPLLVAGIVGTLVYNLDRQFVSYYFSKTDYAEYAFAYSMMNLMMTLITAMSIVLYPSLKRSDYSKMTRLYNKICDGISVIIFLLFAFVDLFSMFIRWFLPKYVPALDIFISILPSVVIMCLLHIVIVNYYKALEITKLYFLLSVFALIVSFAANYTAMKVFGTMKSLTIATVISCIAWFGVGDYLIRCKLHLRSQLLWYVIVMTVWYYTAFAIDNTAIRGVLYFVVSVLLSILFFPSIRHRIISRLKTKK